MPSPTHDLAVHATAVAIGDHALLIRGPSRSGKSTLALALIATSQAARRVVLIGDDRVLLSKVGLDLIASPHPRIAGLIEKRGHGLLSVCYRSAVPVAGIVDLERGPAAPVVSTWRTERCQIENCWTNIEPAETAEAESPYGETGRAGTCDLAGRNFPSLSFVFGSRWDGRSTAVLAWFAATSAAHSTDKMLLRTMARAKD